MHRHWLWLAMVVPVSAYAAQPEATVDDQMVPGDCFVFKTPKSDRTSPIDRIELQYLQGVDKDSRQRGGKRVHLGVQPRKGDDLIPSDITGPCVATGAAETCTLSCRDDVGEKQHGQIQITPVGKTTVKLIIVTPTRLNACSAGEAPFDVPVALVGKTITLTRRGRSDCFH